MSVYNLAGSSLNSVYDISGQSLNAAYDITGEQIFSGADPVIDYSTYTASLYTNASKCIQGFAVYGDYLFALTANNQCKVIDVDRNTLVQTVTITTGHGNSACFSKEFLNDGDEFPLLYVSSCTTKPIYVYVYHIVRSGTEFTFTLVRTLKWTNAQVGYYCDGCVDGDNQIIYMVGYTHNSSSDDFSGENKVRLSAWDLDHLTDNGDETVTPNKLSGDIVTDYFVYALTGMNFHDGLIWSGTGDTSNGAVYGISPQNGEIIHAISTHKTGELEGISWISATEAVVGFWDNYFYKYLFAMK